MNKMERELRRMFGESDIIYKAMYSGKTMIGMIDNDVRIKIEFANTKVSGKYDALKATVINRTDGMVDTTMFKFRDMIGLKNGHEPHIWDDGTKADWFIISPTANDYDKISDILHDYMAMFANENLDYNMHTQ